MPPRFGLLTQIAAALVAALVAVVVYRMTEASLREAHVIQLRSVLSDLRSAQERFHGSSGSYATDLDGLELTLDERVEIRMAAAETGWSAVAWERGRSLLGCAVVVGRVESGFTTPGGIFPTEAEPLVCDE